MMNGKCTTFIKKENFSAKIQMNFWRKLIRPEYYVKKKLTRYEVVKSPAGHMFKDITHLENYEVFYTRVEQGTQQ